jgi:hypothetical protein
LKKNDEKEGERERERGSKSRDRKGELGRERKRSNLQD